MDPVAVLLGTPLFGGLRRQDVEELLPYLGERSFASGQSVWLEGAPASALYVVVRGLLKSHRMSREGGEVVLGFTAGGELAGEVGLFHPGGRRLVSVTAMEPTTCLMIRREPLLAFMTRHPPTMLWMLERLSDIAGRAAYSFSGLAFEDIRRRVARALLTLGDEFGEPAANGTRIRLQLSQSTLAALVAASRENVNRALARFVATGAVSHRDGVFVVHDRACLEQAVAAEP